MARRSHTYPHLPTPTETYMLVTQDPNFNENHQLLLYVPTNIEYSPFGNLSNRHGRLS